MIIVREILNEIVPDFEDLLILVEEDDTPNLYSSTKRGAVPVALAGDGIQGVVQLVLQLAASPKGLVLIEAPEVYRHPRSIWLTARAMLANLDRGIQTVLGAHSLELIDALVSQAEPADLEKLALFDLSLEGGHLGSGRWVGAEIAPARGQLGEDLR